MLLLLLEVLLAVTVAGLCAVLAEFVVGYSPGTLPYIMLVGVIGAYLGVGFSLLIRQLTGFDPILILVRIGAFTFDIVWAFLGSCVILLLLAALRGGRARSIFARGIRE